MTTLAFLLSAGALASCSGSAGEHLPDAPDITCEAGASCGVVGESCLTGDERCECRWTELGSARLFCEPAICPEAVDGQPCTTPGLQCDPDGYSYTLCAADAMWIYCIGARLGQHCPSAPPSDGARCCVIELGSGTDLDCRYPDNTAWRCESRGWTQVSP